MNHSYKQIIMQKQANNFLKSKLNETEVNEN